MKEKKYLHETLTLINMTRVFTIGMRELNGKALVIQVHVMHFSFFRI